MTDSATTSTANPAPAGAGKKNPLDLLEEILKDAQKNPTAGGAPPAAKAAAPAQPSADEAADQAKLAQLAAEAQARQEREAQELQARLQELQTITQTPAYQARVEQEEEQKASDQQHQQDIAGHEIIQLKRTKL